MRREAILWNCLLFTQESHRKAEFLFEHKNNIALF